MLKRKYFFVIAVVLVILFYSIPNYYYWFVYNILNSPELYLSQFHHLGNEERKILKYGNSYVVYKQTVSVFERLHLQDAVLLLPPKEYLKENGVIDFVTAEPSEFYYYTGHKAVWVTSPGVEQATWTLAPKPPIVMLRRIHGKEDLDQLIKLYKPYMPPE